MSTTIQQSPTAQQRTTQDTIRQLVVAVGAALVILGAAWGSGAFGGTPIAEAADDALAADATLLAPATPAFAIWSVIYGGLVLFAIYQALPSKATNARLRSISWWVLASMVLNAAWIGVVQAGWLPLSVVVIALLVAILCVIAVRLVRTRPQTWVEALATDVTVGLYLGWASVATVANVTATLLSGMDDASAGDGAPVAVALLVVVAIIAAVFARFARTAPPLAIATGAAMAWGVAWIAVGRAVGDPQSIPVMWAAVAASAVAIASPIAAVDATSARRRIRRGEPV